MQPCNRGAALIRSIDSSRTPGPWPLSVRHRACRAIVHAARAIPSVTTTVEDPLEDTFLQQETQSVTHGSAKLHHGRCGKLKLRFLFAPQTARQLLTSRVEVCTDPNKGHLLSLQTVCVPHACPQKSIYVWHSMKTSVCCSWHPLIMARQQDARSAVDCVFFTQGRCGKGDACPFNHNQARLLEQHVSAVTQCN